METSLCTMYFKVLLLPYMGGRGPWGHCMVLDDEEINNVLSSSSLWPVLNSIFPWLPYLDVPLKDLLTAGLDNDTLVLPGRVHPPSSVAAEESLNFFNLGAPSMRLVIWFPNLPSRDPPGARGEFLQSSSIVLSERLSSNSVTLVPSSSRFSSLSL